MFLKTSSGSPTELLSNQYSCSIAPILRIRPETTSEVPFTTIIDISTTYLVFPRSKSIDELRS